MVLIQPVDTSNVEEISYFTAGFALHKMFKFVARYVNAAIKQNPRHSLEDKSYEFSEGHETFSDHSFET